jgi:catechol 2,3-dioxygenase-like lactoylglutathione lyase family enzyme
MITQTSLITGTDFITVATKEIDAAMVFYGNVLGLPLSKRWGQMPAAEFETGTLTIAVMQSDAFGLEFRSNNHPIALRVDDVGAARRARVARRPVQGRHHRLRRLPPSVLRGSGRERARASPPLRTPRLRPDSALST